MQFFVPCQRCRCDVVLPSRRKSPAMIPLAILIVSLGTLAVILLVPKTRNFLFHFLLHIAEHGIGDLYYHHRTGFEWTFACVGWLFAIALFVCFLIVETVAVSFILSLLT